MDSTKNHPENVKCGIHTIRALRRKSYARVKTWIQRPSSKIVRINSAAFRSYWTLVQCTMGPSNIYSPFRILEGVTWLLTKSSYVVGGENLQPFFNTQLQKIKKVSSVTKNRNLSFLLRKVKIQNTSSVAKISNHPHYSKICTWRQR